MSQAAKKKNRRVLTERDLLFRVDMKLIPCNAGQCSDSEASGILCPRWKIFPT